MRAERQERQLQCAEAISELGKVAGYLGSADTHLEKVISWWLEMDTILRNLQSQVEKLRADHKGGGTRVWDVKRTWGGAKTDFFTWKVEVWSSAPLSYARTRTENRSYSSAKSKIVFF
jgi:hypothetical protein